LGSPHNRWATCKAVLPWAHSRSCTGCSFRAFSSSQCSAYSFSWIHIKIWRADQAKPTGTPAPPCSLLLAWLVPRTEDRGHGVSPLGAPYYGLVGCRLLLLLRTAPHHGPWQWGGLQPAISSQ
jgi:hypothetical protein